MEEGGPEGIYIILGMERDRQAVYFYRLMLSSEINSLRGRHSELHLRVTAKGRGVVRQFRWWRSGKVPYLDLRYSMYGDGGERWLWCEVGRRFPCSISQSGSANV